MSANDRHCEAIERNILGNVTSPAVYRYMFNDGEYVDFLKVDEDYTTELAREHDGIDWILRIGGLGWKDD